jgi:hypothetical protein
MLYVDDPAHAEQALALRDTESGASFVLAADYALATSHVATILHHTGDRSWLGGHTQARKRNGDSGVARIRPSASSRTIAFAPSDPQDPRLATSTSLAVAAICPAFLFVRVFAATPPRGCMCRRAAVSGSNS